MEFQSLGWKDACREAMAMLQSSCLAKSPRTGKLEKLHFMELQKVGLASERLASHALQVLRSSKDFSCVQFIRCSLRENGQPSGNGVGGGKKSKDSRDRK